jgi:hypothetical protein
MLSPSLSRKFVILSETKDLRTRSANFRTRQYRAVNRNYQGERALTPLSELDTEFRNSLTLTSLQRSLVLERLKKEDIEMTARLRDISEYNLEIFPVPALPHLAYVIEVVYHGEGWHEQLIKYSASDEVRLVARLVEAWASEMGTHYKFSLKAITRLRTGEEIKRQDAESALKTKPVTDGSCFIATATFGSSHPSVAIFRAYRDKILLRTVPGRMVIRAYYKLSPPVARFVFVSYRRKRIARLMLSPLVLIAARRLRFTRN